MALEWPDWFREVLRDAGPHERIVFETDLSAEAQQTIFHAMEGWKSNTDDHSKLVKHFEELVEGTPY